ncbi:unnamed protein product, partial [Amoebophrya sp. A25]
LSIVSEQLYSYSRSRIHNRYRFLVGYHSRLVVLASPPKKGNYMSCTNLSKVLLFQSVNGPCRRHLPFN